MGFTGNGSNRILIFEQTCKAAAHAYAKDPLDADNLTKWGEALLELSSFQTTPEESKSMLLDSLSKLEEALQINPSKADALWLLGSGHIENGLMIADLTEAKVHFGKATLCFEQAVELEPSNELYRKSLEMSPQALLAHAVINGEQTIGSGTPLPIAKSSKKKKKGSDLKYAAFGCVILAAGLVAGIGMAKSRAIF